jgi:ADP-ribosylglycohydrolase
MEFRDRAAGAIMGALIGDALAVGCHWYYDLDELHQNCGSWISGYLKPRAGHYHEGLEAGELSQCGVILRMLMESVASQHEYSERDFCRRLESELFTAIDGTPFSGPGGYTSQSIRDAYRQIVLEGKSWSQIIGLADTTEAAERGIVLAARYAADLGMVARTVSANCVLTQTDPCIVALSTAFNCAVAAVIQGAPLTEELSGRLMQAIRSGSLPFGGPPPKISKHDAGCCPHVTAGHFSSPDALLTSYAVMKAARDPGVRIEPAWKVSEVYGMPCAIYHQLPAAYYLAARFPTDFESAVLHALNGGGQNLSRAKLTGALVGAHVGLKGIPERFILGLQQHERLLELAHHVAADAQARA